MTEFGPPPARLTPRQAALRTAGFHALLETGQPVPPDRLAADLGEDPAGLDADLLVLAGKGLIRIEDGRVLSSLGLTLVQTNHQLGIDGVRWHTWCALDALGIIGALAIDGWIRSVNRVTGDEFHIMVTDGALQSAGPPPVLFVAGQAPVASVIDQWCPLVNFFPSREAVLRWRGQAGPEGRCIEGRCLSLAEAFSLAAKLWHPLIASRTSRTQPPK